MPSGDGWEVSPGERLVEVAVDVPGQGGDRTYTYAVPPDLLDLRAGEPVLVEYGRREAVGIVLGEAEAPTGVTVKRVAARVRADGPLLPALQLALVREVARHYLAPLALVVRAAVPPGLLERLDLVAIAGGAPVPPGADGGVRGDAAPGNIAGPLADVSRAPLDAALIRIAAAGPHGVALRSLAWAGGRAALVRELRALEAVGTIHLEWRLTASGSPIRLERRVALTAAGRAAVRDSAAAGGARLGVRQREVLGVLAVVPSGETLPAARLSAAHGAGTVAALARRGLVELSVGEHVRRPLAYRSAGSRGPAPPDASLSVSQARASRAIIAAVYDRRAGTFLLDGVTGAGRTAVYAVAIDAALAVGRGALVLVPEIALAMPLVDRLRAGLGLDIALVHGALSDGERSDEWRRIRAGEARIVVGTRTAVLAPLEDPGVVIVDEEHDAAYKSDRTPRYQARDVALELGRLARAPVVLGSATPDVATLGRALAGEIEHFPLAERVSGALPRVTVVDLRAELAAGNRGLLSRPLAAALAALDVGAGDRAILMINRRGSASVVLCRDCGYVQVCPECRRPLVYHAAAVTLRCHHCGATAPLADRCPACGSPRIRYLGGGTERLEREVRERFPRLRTSRLDRDVLARRGAGERVLDDLRDGRIDVLVGTGLVAKGIDVPEVTLVGVVSADIALNLPDIRAAERTYQLLAQAVGRAGRGEQPGQAFVQTYQPTHAAVLAVASGDAGPFYEAELAARRAFGLPPYGRLVKLTVALEDRDSAEVEAARMAASLRERAAAQSGTPGAATPPHEVLGPVPAYIARRAGRWRFHLVVRGPDPVGILERDPGPPWSVDVDPESLL